MSGEHDDLAKVDLVGQVVDQKYKVLALLGRGGMGAVYLAHHLQLNKDVALKTFVSANLSDDIRQRFKREAQAIAKLRQKNIVQVFDFGVADGGVPYYTMEHLDGESVGERLERKGALETEEALQIFSGLCQGLAHCHKNGVVHRDIKPGNIFLELRSSTNDGITAVKLVDFGIVTLTDNSLLPNQKLTAAGAVFGSPLYMSPEQSMGRSVDARSDIYSSGCTLFEMLTGKPPFRAASAVATMLCHQEVTAPTLKSVKADGEFPLWLEALVAKLLTKDPEERLQSLEDALDIVSSNQSSERAGSASASGHTKRASKLKIVLGASLILVFLAGAFAVSIIAFRESHAVKTTGKDVVKDDNKKITVAPLARYRLLPTSKGVICFQFPDTEIGKINQGSEKQCKEAARYVEIADGDLIVFRAGQAVLEKPELLNGFGPDDLHTLILDDGTDGSWSDAVLPFLERLRSIKKLQFYSARLSSAAIVSLNKLPALIDLRVEDTGLEGKDLLRLQRLSKLQSLGVVGLKDTDVLIDKLALDNTLFHFTAQYCAVTDRNLESIGTMKTLLNLNLANNFITAKSVPALLKLTNLRELDLSGNPIDASALPTILKLNKTMDRVYMPAIFWNSETILQMRKRFPHSRLNWEAPKDNPSF